MNAATTMRKKAIASPALGDDPLLYVLSDETPDRAGDIIKASAWDLTNFVKNPIALFGHSHSFIIGHWSDVKVRGKQLIGRLNLLPQGVSDRIDELRATVAAGVLRSISVGFLPDMQKAELNEHGGYTFAKCELTEASLVAVGMNPSALQLAKALNLSADTQAMIFGRPAAGSHKSAAHLDLPKPKPGVVCVEVKSKRSGVVKIGPVTRARVAGTLKINTAKRWQPGDPIRIVKTGTPVVRLSRQDCSWLDKPSGPTRVVKLTKADIERGKRRASHRVVKLGGR